MLNATLLDNQQVTVHANPKTASGGACGAFNFAVTNPNSALIHVLIAAGPNPNPAPTFTVTPQIRFFGPDRVVTLTLSGLTQNFGVSHSTDMTVTVQGSLPDDGLLDHFEPTADPPVAQ